MKTRLLHLDLDGADKLWVDDCETDLLLYCQDDTAGTRTCVVIQPEDAETLGKNLLDWKKSRRAPEPKR
jgi:hypothetical protein